VSSSSISIASGLRERSQNEERAYDHPGHFHEYVFQQKLAPFHWEMFELLLEGMKAPLGDMNPALILAPRDHAKTTNVTESYPLWRVGLNPLELVQIICSTSSLARKRLRKIASCIQFNERYIQLFGNLYPNDSDFVWSRDELEVLRDRTKVWKEGSAERDATFAAFGITTSVEGGRATLQAYDDIVTFENSKTDIGRSATSDKVWMSFDPMLLPQGQQIYIGTRFHYADFYSELIAKLDTEGRYVDEYLEAESNEGSEGIGGGED
jgi:hypothetical protein